MRRSRWANPAVMIPMVLIIVAVAARGVCRAMLLNPHADAMMAATAVNIFAAELALLPLLFVRGATQLAVVQAGLVVTMVQMFLAVILSAIAMYVMHSGQPFVFWVIPMYWIALAMLVASLIGAIRQATVANSANNPAGALPLQSKVTNP